ncbi:MAG: hypothetical protein H0V69_01420 [Acidimicrobiia bacterium]|nr:hypothetical protein [Acidimicrobiia bacterium]
MTDKLKGILIAAAAIATLAIGGAAIAAAAGGGNEAAGPADAEEAAENESGAEEAGENESSASEAAEQATGPTADDAASAALAEVGGGQVLEVEHGDDGASGYEVEVERPDGSYVEVNLDENLNVVSTGSDD